MQIISGQINLNTYKQCSPSVDTVFQILLNCLTVSIIHIEVDDIFLFFIYGKPELLCRIMAPLDVFPSSEYIVGPLSLGVLNFKK